MRKLLLLVFAGLLVTAPVAEATPPDQILDNLQQLGFNYFWNEANPASGMIRDRNASGSLCSIAAVGFGLSSICIGIDHGWITRAQGAARVQTTLNSFWTLPQGSAASGTIGYNGFFYHFLDMNTGLRGGGSELSDIDTALLLAGILDCKQYFNGPDPTEVSIRTLADQIYQRVDWTFFRNATLQGLMIQWKPENGFNTAVWKGYNEMMIMYLLAIGSPTHPIPGTDWNTYVSGYVYGTLYGQTYVQYGALFTHQYSHCWIDFRNKRDAFMQTHGPSDYFQNSRKATLAQQAYCIANPGPKGAGFPDPAGYSATLWGLTAGDDPASFYAAHGAPGPGTFDNGTIGPTAVFGSLPFAADICVPTIQNIFDSYPALWGTYGLKDGFNLARSPDWYDTDFLGIDQGPIVMMIENYRTASVWTRFMKNTEITNAIAAAGFVSLVGVENPPPSAQGGIQLRSGPNPFSIQTKIGFDIPRAGRVRLTVHDVTGREVARLLDGWIDAGHHSVIFRSDHLASGVYWYHLDTGDTQTRSRGVLMR
jgi:hypothetical protein